jgi:hypothetical protein
MVLITPTHDRFAPSEKVNQAMERLTKAYATANVSTNLVRVSPEKYNHFDNTMQSLLLNAMQPFKEGR